MGDLNHASGHFQQLQLPLVEMAQMKAAEYYIIHTQPPKLYKHSSTYLWQ